MIAKQDLGPGSDIFEADLAFVADEVLGHAAHISFRLIRETRQSRPVRLRLNNAAQRAIDEEGVIDRADAGCELAHSDAEPRAEVHLLARLHEPAGLGQLLVDGRPRAVFGVKNCCHVMVRDPLYRRLFKFTAQIRIIPAIGEAAGL